jgi:predicted HAD superfamily hydrolase
MIDKRLLYAYKLIEEGTIKVLSLDIFDTLLWRKVPLPIDVFSLLGRKLKSEGYLIDALPQEAFLEFRVKAESLARIQKAKATNDRSTEVTLKEIYWQLNGIFNRITIEEMVAGKNGIINESDIDDLVKLEIESEKKFLLYDQEILKLIQFAKEKNVKVTLVSNTYFEKEHILKFLTFEDVDLDSYVDQLFLSSEYEISKNQGLFSKVIEHFNVHSQAILHIGDNEEADIKAAKRFGLLTLYFPKWNKSLQKVLEEELPKTDIVKRGQFLDDQEGDFGLTTLRGKIPHFNPYDKKNEVFFWNYGSQILAPFLIGFIHWVYKRCQQLKTQKVYCLMREGRLYCDLIKENQFLYPDFLIEAKELWISRRFSTHACIAYGTKEELSALTKSHPASRFTVESYCKYLGLDIKSLPKLLKWRHFKLEGDKLIGDVIKIILKDKDAVKALLEVAAQKRKRLLNYLQKEWDLSNNQDIILIDIGWTGTIQGALQTILKLSGFQNRIHGLYLGTVHGTEKSLLNGFIREGYLIKANYPENLSYAVLRGLYVLEQTATTGIGTLMDIDEKGNVITEKNRASKKQIKEVSLVREGIKAFSSYLGSYILKMHIQWNATSQALLNLLRENLLRMTSYPTKEEATYLGNWRHDHVSVKGTSQHILGKNAYYEHYIENMVPKIAFEDWGMTWPAAYAAKKSLSLVKALEAYRLRTLPEDSFLSQDFIELKVFINNSIKPLGISKVRSNANRKFYAFFRLQSLQEPIEELKLEFNLSSQLIRINSLRLTLHTDLKKGEEQYVFFESEKDELLFKASSIQIAPKTFHAKEPFILTHLLEVPQVNFLKINLCFEIFDFNLFQCSFQPVKKQLID